VGIFLFSLKKTDAPPVNKTLKWTTAGEITKRLSHFRKKKGFWGLPKP
jgi:hypothetical protein